MVPSKLRVLAGVSLLALSTVASNAASAANVPGIRQDAGGTIAINLLEIDPTDPPVESGAVVDVSNPGGAALAEAIVTCAESATCPFPGAVAQYALGSQSAANTAIVDGILSVGANAVADGAAATAAGVIQIGLWQVAGADDAAENNISIAGTVGIIAEADAMASTGSAVAFGGIGAGISQIASSIGIDGIAVNSVANSGDLTIAANADAEAALLDAAATAIVGVGIYQEANGQQSAAAVISNSGDILIEADASALAGNGIAVATASAAGIVQMAEARTQQFTSGFTSGGNLVGITQNNPSGPASAVLTNSGSIEVDVHADALGGVDAAATGVVLGVAQVASGSDAEAIIGNSGSIDIAASVDSEGSGTPRGVVFVSGLSQAATAFEFSTLETIDPNGVLTYELSSTPVGPAVASLTNAGDISVVGEVDVIALGSGTMDEGLGVAFVDGLDQYANGDGALATVENSGSFNVTADVSVDSGNVSNAVAIASGIDQFATAYASHATIVFANGTTTPTTFTGGATAIGSAVASFDNSGSLTVIANVESHGDQVAFGGATASAVGQYAAGTDASVQVSNGGSIAVVGTLSSSGHTAFGGAAAIGMQQGAQGTAAADALFENGGTLAVLASAAADGKAGAFVNATAFGGAQNVQADQMATAAIVNGGTIDIRAVASAVAGDTSTFDMAMAFADAHGMGQIAEGKQALVEFDNSGAFQLLADVDASANDFALASATASGVIQQIALGTASRTGAATIDNSGTILVGASADVAAGSTAMALAGIQSAIVQAVIAGEGGTASLTNSGSIAMVANAEALAAGGDVTDFAGAQAYIFGINAMVTATGLAGSASVDLSNAGTIDITAIAHATASGAAQGLASAISGLVGSANVWGDGDATVSLTNEGSITLVGAADATGGYTAHATGIALRGMDGSAAVFGAGDATVEIANSGSVLVGADAHAEAGTNALAVAIAIDGFQAVAHVGTGDALASVDNVGELEMIANATASALNAQAFAIVGGTFFTGAVFESAAAMNGDASVMVGNSGSISVVADALANGEVIASASAVGGPGINQFAFATSGDAVGIIDNSGSLEFAARGEANATNSAYADAVFYNAVAQGAFGFGGNGTLDLTNEGSISIAVVADAAGDNAAGALAVATHEIGQVASIFIGNATVELDNSGSIEIDVAALAEGSFASASAVMDSAIIQGAAALGEGEASVALDNSGSIDIALLASAESPDGAAGAFALLGGAITQYAGAGSSQYVYGSTAGGLTQITQTIFPTGPASLSLNNSGSVQIAAAALAEGGTSASAVATGLAIDQFARGSDADASLVNEGSMAIELTSIAEADTNAAANGTLTGVHQAASAIETVVHITATGGGGQVTDSATAPVGSALVSFANSGSIEIVGVANAEAASGSASANMFVKGIEQSVAGLEANAVFTNSGEYLVGAQAIAEGTAGFAVAHAVGVAVSGQGHLSGEFDNGGDFTVAAVASGASGATAVATGIELGAGSSDFELTNSGSIIVSAEVNSGFSEAVAIRVTDNGTTAFDPSAEIIITNDGGTIIARRSEDGGETWLRGTAIDTSSAPNPSVIDLLGDGSIFGHIDLAAGDTINVAGGETWFDGVINPECQSGGCLEGTLNIGSGGALFLRHDSAGSEGPSAAFVEELNIAAGGTLIFELPTGEDPEAAYPQIVADVANLDGTLLVRSGSNLYGDSYLFEDVIDANVRNGQFDSCGIDGNPALLELNCVYDAQGNVDLGLERIAFNAVDGLTRNQGAVGSGIEALYDVNLAGPFAEMIASLFTFDDGEYRSALDQLSGATYAAYQQSFHSLGTRYNQLIDRATECTMPRRAASAIDCRTTGKVHLWGQLDAGSRKLDGDAEAPGYDSDHWTAIIGADVRVGTNAVIGASFAKVSDDADYRDGSWTEADGYLAGLYATFDPGSYYVKAIGTFSRFDGDGERRTDWGDYGAELQGRLTGDPDIRLVTLGLHAGYRVELGANSLLTPYAGVDYSSVRLDDFTETGLEAAKLSIDGSTSSRTLLSVGTKWATDLGSVIPEAEIGYLHNFGDRRTSFDAMFLDDPDARFEVVSAAEKRGSLLAGISLGGKAGPVDVRIGYQGLFNGDGATHSAGLKLTLPLGGH